MSYTPPVPAESYSSSFDEDYIDKKGNITVHMNSPYMYNNIDPLLNPPHAPPPPHIPTWAEYYYKRLAEHHVPTRLPDSSFGEYDAKYKKFYERQMSYYEGSSISAMLVNHATRGMLEIVTGLAACYIAPKIYRTAWRYLNPTAPLPTRPPFKFFFGLAKYGGFILLYSSYQMIYCTEWRLFPAPFGYDPEIPHKLDDRLGIDEKRWPNLLFPGSLIYSIVNYKKLKAEIDESKKKITETKKLRALEFLYGTPAQKEAAAKPRPIQPPLF